MSVKCWQDLGFDHFSLPLTSLVLRTLRPLVWQPAITPMMPGGIGTPVFPVNMVGSRAQQRVPVAFESSKTEVMARAISWRLWAVFHERVRVTTPTIDWFDEFFDAIAIAARLECNGTGPLVINGSPLAHLSFKTLYHDRVPPEEQRRVFDRPPPGVRKVVLTTNIAETAITVDDVAYAADHPRDLVPACFHRPLASLSQQVRHRLGAHEGEALRPVRHRRLVPHASRLAPELQLTRSTSF